MKNFDDGSWSEKILSEKLPSKSARKLEISEILILMPLWIPSFLCSGALKGGVKSGVESASLDAYASHVLLQICSQPWVRERLLRNPDHLCTPELLLDNTLSHTQVSHHSIPEPFP